MNVHWQGDNINMIGRPAKFSMLNVRFYKWRVLYEYTLWDELACGRKW